MTFAPERYCHMVAGFEKETDEPFAAGGQGDVCVALLLEGTAALAGPEARFVPAGGVVVSPEEVQFEPAGRVLVSVAQLGGDAAKEMAATLAGALVLAPGVCPGASELLFRLGQSKSVVRGSALAYSLLCVLAEAPREKALVSPLVAEALEHMHARYGEVYGVEELAEEMGVSKGHLIRSFRAAIGIPPGRYLMIVRIEAVKRLLLQGEYPLDVLAGLCGFSGSNYLCRIFKREVGKSPLAWKKQYGGGAVGRPAMDAEWEASLYL